MGRLTVQVAICVLLGVPVSIGVVSWRGFAGLGGEQAEVVPALVVASVVIAAALRWSSFWQLRDLRILRIWAVGASLLAASSVVLQPAMNRWLARSQGPFDSPAPWSTPPSKPDDAQVFQHPIGRYALALDARWQAREESSGHRAYELRRQGQLVAELLPSCWYGRELADLVAAAHRRGAGDGWSCGLQGRLPACRHQDDAGRVEFWLQREESGSGAQLVYRVHGPIDEAVLVEAAATLAFTGPAEPVGCALPAAWATF